MFIMCTLAGAKWIERYMASESAICAEKKTGMEYRTVTSLFPDKLHNLNRMGSMTSATHTHTTFEQSSRTWNRNRFVTTKVRKHLCLMRDSIHYFLR